MLVWLIEWVFPAGSLLDARAEVVHHVALRSFAAAVSVALLSWASGPAAIRWLARHFREPVKSASAQLDHLHRAKASTPTMGGIFLIAGIAIAALTFSDPGNRLVLVAVAVAIGLALVGAVDDLVKLRSRGSDLAWKPKLAAQMCVAAVPAICWYCEWCGPAAGHFVLLPGGAHLELGWLAIPWIMLLVVAASNAVNLADGLDGLAAGSMLPATTAIAMAAYLFGDTDAQELVVVAGAMVGGLLGFLPYNRYPARVFMGNVGSLSLGGLLAVLAIGPGIELLLPIAAGIFVVEALSVIVQIGWYKRTGQRVLRCAPLHHHFEFAGWSERKIVGRFWIVSATFAVATIALAPWLSPPTRDARLSPSTPSIAGVRQAPWRNSPLAKQRMPLE